ncbi:hypothetical protein MASR2M18_20100 [Ignavibacteria bacterium]
MMLCIVACGVVMSSCTSPLDINTERRQTSGSIPNLPAKFLSLTFEGEDISGVQDGFDVSWYSGITDSVRIDTSGRIVCFGLNIPDIKVKNVIIGKYTELRSLSVKFDSLICSNIAMPIENGMTEVRGAEMIIISGMQPWKITADGKKMRVSISATEFRPARMIQFRIAVTLSDFGFQPQKDMKFNVKGMAVY